MQPQFDPPVSISILGLRSASEDEGVARMVTEALRRAADGHRATGLAHTGVEDDLAPLMLVYGCEHPSLPCLMQIGDAMLADYFVFGLIEPESGRRDAGYAVTLSLYNVQANREERTLSEVIDRGTTGEALDQAVVGFYGALTGTELPGALSITCAVTGAEVRLGGEGLGTIESAPLVIDDLRPGLAPLTVNHEGYQPWERRVNIVAGHTTEVTVELLPE